MLLGMAGCKLRGRLVILVVRLDGMMSFIAKYRIVTGIGII